MYRNFARAGAAMALNPTEPKWSLRLPADCSIAAIRSVYDLIREAFGREQRLEIDCSRVDKADVTSIQLLLSTAKTGEAQGRPVVLTAFSQSLRNTLRRAGFASEAMIEQHFPQKKDGT
ncbi:blr2341 [Bradyrhizobium diazoefficiens USDA 110]|uniref:Blr2341 protein n=2 Tax=Bradyrhizobium diazoefficiens TaxID=1355477 RepID=Q89SQ9_BRADU|nr:STAS domain-containing protein [Bradyrhizobium diazoefficiens]QBP21168.1 STAS domain-containing protein [Bradyrhizobium diazoefficiens]QHP72617.1 STAS domain-containing protein [Bradyrhizobium sp. LCT2]BAC47606.1 blr2341 [Bradyrhizobium diazoefficiens USDA 110]